MGIVTKIRNIFKPKEKAVSFVSETGAYLPYGGNYRYFFAGIGSEFTYNDRDFVEYAYLGYGRNPHVYSVVEYISQSFASLPRDWFELPDAEEPIERKPSGVSQVDTLLSQPNWRDSENDFFVQIVTQLLVTGNAIIYAINPVGFSQPAELFVAPTKDVTIQTDNGTEQGRPITYYITDVGTISADYVLHLRLPNPLRNTYWGLSPLYAGQTVYAAGNNTFEAAASIHKNRGRNGAIFPKGGDMGILPQHQEQFQKDWDNRTAGPQKFGGVHASPMELGYVGWGMSPTDLKLIEQNIENLRDICRLYGVPSQLLGDKSASTYNNVQEARKTFYENVLKPLSSKIDKAIAVWLLGLFGVSELAYYCIDESKIPILNEPKRELSDKLISEVNAGILTANEARAIMYPELNDIENEQANDPI